MNQNLSNAEQRQLHQAMTDIESSLVGFRRLFDDQVVNLIPAREYDELRAYLGSIGDAHYRLDQLLYTETPATERAIALIAAAEPCEHDAAVDAYVADKGVCSLGLPL